MPAQGADEAESLRRRGPVELPTDPRLDRRPRRAAPPERRGRRAARRGILPNVAVALGNGGSPEALPALAAALKDEEPLVRGHAAWALGRIYTIAGAQALTSPLEFEADPWVREEIELALGPAAAA